MRSLSTVPAGSVVINALVAAETMVGANGNTVHALPHDRLRALLRKQGRLVER